MLNLLFLGFIEVNLNSTFFELDKATDVKKVDLTKELSNLICLYECAEENTSKDMLKRAVKRRLTCSSGNFGSDKLYSNCTKLHERFPRLKTSSIHQLLLGALKKFEGDFKDESAVHSNLFDLLPDNLPVLPVNLSFILKICMRQLDFISSLGKDDPLNTEQGNINSLGLPLLIVILSLKSTEKSQRKKDIKGREDIDCHRKNIHLALVCLKKLIALSECSLDCANLMNDLLSVARDEIASGNVSDTRWDNHSNIHDIVDPGRSKEIFIEKIIKPLLQEFLGLSNFLYFHEVEVICDIVMMITSTMVGEKKNLIGEWATGICQSTYIRNPEVAKRLVSLVISLTSAPNDLLVVQDMATQLLQVVGSEKAAPLDKSEAYTVINKSTSAAIANSILQFIKSIICDMDSVIGKLRACIAAQKEDPKVLALEFSLYARAEATALVLTPFLQMNLKGPQTEKFMRNAAKFFRCSAQILKFLIAPRVGKHILRSEYKKFEQATSSLFLALIDFTASKPGEQKVGLIELQNQLDVTERKELIQKVNELERESECNLELIAQLQEYSTGIILVIDALLRERKRSQGSGGEEGKGNVKNSSPEANSPEAAADDPGSPEVVGIDIQAKKRVKTDVAVEDDPDGPTEGRTPG
ncbi:unnamed protein product [Cuscuta campestris]|uniref:FANCI solenoid 4 domain-containing protein n=1 Tax=Cuscuta campestris TaxID=132261 RepID=A0A484KBK8_9ASTE|nr:unnamed protein product [Cuscuta campestris]